MTEGAQVFGGNGQRRCDGRHGQSCRHHPSIVKQVQRRPTRGELLGTVVSAGGIPPHLHVALVEIVGGLPDGQHHGVDLYWFFLDLEATDPGTVVPVTFLQDGSPPVPQTP